MSKDSDHILGKTLTPGACRKVADLSQYSLLKTMIEKMGELWGCIWRASNSTPSSDYLISMLSLQAWVRFSSEKRSRWRGYGEQEKHVHRCRNSMAITGLLHRGKSHIWWMLRLDATPSAGRKGRTPSPDQLLAQIPSCEQPKVLGGDPILCIAALKLYHENDTL